MTFDDNVRLKIRQCKTRASKVNITNYENHVPIDLKKIKKCQYLVWHNTGCQKDGKRKCSSN